MNDLRLDDDSARHCAELRAILKEPIADAIRQYFTDQKMQPDWSPVILAQLQVLIDSLNSTNIDKVQARMIFDAMLAHPELQFNAELEVAGLKIAARNGYLDAMTRLAEFYLHGYRVNKDINECIYYLELAAENGSMASVNKLAEIYAYGVGVQADHTKSVEYFKKSATSGDMYGQYGLGIAFRKGWGVEKNENADLFWITLAAEQGLDQAQHDIAWNYHMNEGFGINYQLAYFWYQLAAAQGFMDSINNLGELYLHGNGVEKNLSEALKWFSIAALHGDEDAKNSVSEIKNKISREDEEASIIAMNIWLDLHSAAKKRILEDPKYENLTN